MGKSYSWVKCLVLAITIASVCPCLPALSWQAGDEQMVADGATGHAGGRLMVALRSEPKTLNPAMAGDETSRDVIRCLTADLIHINRGSLKTEPSLAKAWTV